MEHILFYPIRLLWFKKTIFPLPVHKMLLIKILYCVCINKILFISWPLLFWGTCFNITVYILRWCHPPRGLWAYSTLCIWAAVPPNDHCMISAIDLTFASQASLFNNLLLYHLLTSTLSNALWTSLWRLNLKLADWSVPSLRTMLAIIYTPTYGTQMIHWRAIAYCWCICQGCCALVGSFACFATIWHFSLRVSHHMHSNNYHH